MKIRAIRLAEVGCFSQPVALENLSDGLNVLAGANEVGKSTVLAALRLAFELSHKTAASTRLEPLRPYAGGAPLIEVDFSIAGSTWRLRKRYLASKMAELTNLATGQVARGSDAEDQLAVLLGQVGGRSSLPLLWAAQGEALAPAPPGEDAAAHLKRVVASEVAATAGGSEARAVRAAVRADLDRYLTNHKPPRPKGDYDVAVKSCSRLAGDLELAHGRRDAALSRLDRLSELNAAEALLCDPARQAALSATVASTHSALTTARDAQQKHRTAAQAAEAANTHLALARTRRDGLAADLAALEALSAEIADDQDASRDHASGLAAAETSAAEARDARDAARAGLAAAERELKAAVETERRLEAHQRLGELRETHAAAESAIASGLELRAQLDQIAVTPDLLRQIRTEGEAVRRLEDRLAAASPKITVAYMPGAAGRIHQNGIALAAGAHTVGQPIVLTIDGIGTIEIAPGASQDSEAANDRLAQHRVALSEALVAANAGSIEDAEALLAERQRLDADIREARVRLGALVPGGLSKLGSEIDALAARAGSSDDIEVPRPPADIERDVESARERVAQASSADDAAQRQFGLAREAAGRHAAAAAERLRRITELEDALPASSARDAALQQLVTAAEDSERELNAAVREVSAWRDLAPDAARLQQLESDAAQAENARKANERERDTISRSVASLEGELRADRNDGVEARVAELEGALAAARQRQARIEDDIAALQLLDAELLGEEQSSRDQYLKPVTERLAPLVSSVFPRGELAVAENLGIVGLQRGEQRETINALSGGTQEQIAVMVRLAFGKLMADSGHAVPVILDDALVYSDDERILHMFAALIGAAQHHQLIVLTCRSHAFRHLDGHRLSMAAWQIDEGRPGFSIAS